jgi:hypothetical protein
VASACDLSIAGALKVQSSVLSLEDSVVQAAGLAIATLPGTRLDLADCTIRAGRVLALASSLQITNCGLADGTDNARRPSTADVHFLRVRSPEPGTLPLVLATVGSGATGHTPTETYVRHRRR